MKPYWNELFGPRPGLSIREVKLEHDNVYIKDQLGRVWQLWVEMDSPIIQKAGDENE